MAVTEVKPFKVNIPDEEIDLIRKKLELTRFPEKHQNAEWAENNGVTPQFMKDTIRFWVEEYDWRKEEEKINEMPQFTTTLTQGEFGSFDVHFIHAKSEVEDAIPLIFIHGWPGSFIEVRKILPKLLAAGFHVVAPSLLGYGFSSYTDKAGLNYTHHAEVFHNLMLRLGYEKYAVQGGDWGAFVARSIAVQFPGNARVLHTNIVLSLPPSDAKELKYTDSELAQMKRAEMFQQTGIAYQQVQSTKPRTIGFAMHDSPAGLLAWITDKLFAWTDDYPWTPTEIITWTLMHYLPGPTTGFNMYRENIHLLFDPPPHLKDTVVTIPFGFSAFAKELMIPPRAWVEKNHNVVYWKEHAKGGHFAAYERPEEFSEDVIEFVKKYWN